ncbi:uncharacterized protein LOC110029241 [Phalaenopsis equestris]|uniref:uncharacterized protein LOC110029241 n=1 Tax=Phalaenopsis equestris TaxID=78828 RepID=UPI0009E21D6A|nr:uncharacterized protein LOC110029241 [Phalaenopsis equestris]XP_020587098.1 uncharacterized protein LOC110029241 [Phalaenopsis equestris]XP_020587099.1 uncharacterized protein LOC110029241 [Phalaenopsis equestris]
MAEELVPVMCYHGGRIVMHGRTPEYNGGSMEGVPMSKSTIYSDLLKKVNELTATDPKQFKLIMKCRFPTSGSDYVALEVKDEVTTKMMFGLYPRVYSLELFVERCRISESVELEESMVREPMEMGAEGGDSLSSSQHGTNKDTLTSNSNHLHENVFHPSDNLRRTIRNKARCLTKMGGRDPNCTSKVPFAESNQRDGNLTNEPIEVENMEVDSKGNAPNWKNLYEEDEDEDDDDLVSDSIIRNTCRGFEDDPVSSDGLLHIGKVFEDKEALKQSLQEYSIRRHVEYQVLRSTKKIFNVSCTQKGCPWQLRARLAKHLQRFKIKFYGGDHTCSVSTSTGDHKQCDTKFISTCITPLVKRKSNVNPAEVIAWMANEYNIKISYSKAWLGLSKALKKIHGSWDDSYAMLPEYLNVVQEANPGTFMQLLTNEKGEVREFHRLFWSFNACIEGFRNLRPMIAVDSAELHGKYAGNFLVATGVDGNDSLFPLAFAITESETESTWTWFLGCIRQCLTNRVDVTIISDRGRGLMEAVKAVYPSGLASHRYCMKQLSCSLRKEFKDETLVNLFWEAAKKTEACEFDETMKILGERNPGARAWLEKIGVEKWSFAHDGGKRFGIMTTNIVETCDSLLKGARGLPIRSLVAKTLSRLGKLFDKRREEGGRMLGIMTSNIESQLSEIVNLAVQHMVEPYSTSVFKVYRVNHRPHNVNMDTYTCTCNRFVISGIPCAHITAVCMSMQISYYNLCAKYFTSDVYRQTYDMKLHPVEEENASRSQEGKIVTPPAVARKRGRPPSVRINKGMPAAVYRCSKCKQDGHNFRTCKTEQLIHGGQIEHSSCYQGDDADEQITDSREKL